MAKKTTKIAKTTKKSAASVKARIVETDTHVIIRMPDWVKDINTGSVIVRKDGKALVNNNNFKDYNKFGLVMWHANFVERAAHYDYKKRKVVEEEYIDLKLFGVDASANTALGKFRLTATIATNCVLDGPGTKEFIDTFTKRRMMVAREEMDKASTALFYAQERLLNLHNIRVKYGLSNEDEELNV